MDGTLSRTDIFIVPSIRAAMVGDRIYDVAAAKANRVPSIACLYGCGTREELKEASCFAGSPAEVGRLADTLLCVEKE